MYTIYYICIYIYTHIHAYILMATLDRRTNRFKDMQRTGRRRHMYITCTHEYVYIAYMYIRPMSIVVPLTYSFSLLNTHFVSPSFPNVPPRCNK